MLTQAQIVIGQYVTMSATSKWLGGGENPSDTVTQGVITGTDAEWIEVLWNGKSEPLNYKSYDLDAVA